MGIGTIVFGGQAGDFATSRTLSVNFGTNADRALIVEVMNTGGSAGGVTGVVIDPTGANITMTAETQTGPLPGTGATGYLRRFRAFGSNMPTGTKSVVISVAAGDSVINARAIPMDGVSNIAAAVNATSTGVTLAVTVPSASGRTVLMSAVACGIPDARTLTPVDPATLVKRINTADHYFMHGIIVQTPGATSVTPTVTASTGTEAAIAGWDLTQTSTNTAPTITTQPSATSVTAGATATFTAAASGSPTPTWQWQRSTDGGNNWSNVTTGTGGTTASYTTAATTVSGGSANNNDRYRAVATNVAGSATSNGVILTVNASSDSSPPSMSGTVSVTPGSTTASALCPTASDNVGVVAYDASIDGTTWPFTSSTPTISITGLSPSTPYTGRFRARDAAGNVSSTLTQAFTTLTAAPPPADGTVTISDIRNSTGTSLAGTTLPNVVVLRRSDRSWLTALTAQTINGSGNLVISSSALPVGVGVVVVAFNDTGTETGAWSGTVA